MIFFQKPVSTAGLKLGWQLFGKCIQSDARTQNAVYLDLLNLVSFWHFGHLVENYLW